MVEQDRQLLSIARVSFLVACNVALLHCHALKTSFSQVRQGENHHQQLNFTLDDNTIYGETSAATISAGKVLDVVLATSFTTPLSDIFKRAKSGALDRLQNDMSIPQSETSAASKADPTRRLGKKMANVFRFVQSNVTMGAGQASGENIVKDLSKKIQNVQREIDQENRRCNKLQKELDHQQVALQGSMGIVSQRMSSLETRSTYFAGEMMPSANAISAAQELLHRLHADCLKRREERMSEVRSTGVELQAIRQLKRQIGQACRQGSLLLACKMATHHGSGHVGETTRSRSSQVDGHMPWQRQWEVAVLMSNNNMQSLGLLSDSAASLLDRVLPMNSSEPESTVSGKPNSCPPRVQPNCDAMSDAMDSMESGASENKDAADQRLSVHDKECKSQVQAVNAAMQAKVSRITQSQNLLATSESKRAERRLEAQEQQNQLNKLVQRAIQLHKDCRDTAAEQEEELCGLIEARQGVYWKFVNSDRSKVIEDCLVSDWSAGPCSKTCSPQAGSYGEQVLTRTVLFSPDDSTEEGRLAAGCPALSDSWICNDEPCPQDCHMKEWSEWGACSRECGGGQQFRMRKVDRPGLYGGLVCGATTETRICNIKACRVDCVLGDWEQWSHCSRRCTWTHGAPPGHAHRVRHIRTPAASGGACPGKGDRTQYRECNSQMCPHDLNQINCTADQDIIVMLDGSGSLSLVGPSSKGAATDQNFLYQKEVVKNMIQHSVLTGASSSGSTGVRYGLILYGTKTSPQVLSSLSGDKMALLQSLTGAAWPHGSSPVGQAMYTTSQVLRLSQGARHETAVLFTDGRVRKTKAAKEASQQLAATGVRIVVVLVQESGDVASKVSDHFLCKLASAPCFDNVLRAERWGDVPSQLGRLLSVVCPASFSAHA